MPYRGLLGLTLLVAVGSCGRTQEGEWDPGVAGNSSPDATAGSSAGASGSGGVDGQAGAWGEDAGSATYPDSCESIACRTPPKSTCADSYRLRTYDAVGSCANGQCSYAEHLTKCKGNGCSVDHCQPVDSCEDTVCPFGCVNGTCNPDPCSHMECTTQPSICKDAHTTTSYGSCAEGMCNDAATDTPCPTNTQCAGSGVCSTCATDSACGANCTACPAESPKCKGQGDTSQCVSCLTDLDCAADQRCDTASNACVGVKPDGQLCSVDRECTSNSCGGRCCPTGTSCYCPQPSAHNLLRNPGFDANGSDWSKDAGSLASIAWADAAETNGACPYSGSMKIAHGFADGSGSFQFLQCVPLDEHKDKTFYFGAALRNGDGTDKCVSGECYIQWLTGGECQVAYWDSSDMIELQSSAVGWVTLSTGPLTPPADASAARVGCFIRGGAVFSTCVFGFDEISFTEAPAKY